MKRDKKITQLAKKLVELSKDNGVVTEAKVGEVLAGLKQVKHRHHLTVLKAFLVYLRREVALQTAVVSTPAALSADALAAIEAKFSSVYGRTITAVIKQDTSLIAGVRVRVGDDVYDASVSGRLQRLAESVN
ncbi:MAG: F0F1 ATP synthase subunit delta [Opitutales bacterium]|jgi:F-type H+-transporting ATPase subunit delta|nr:F0F1 ATP synthase subunit delta [Opitutales bacterium]MDP4644156.1 F0F1 ATP synthase subunit delta [Opitutales bacterium]MDP4693909.1 F0F1 ATP synthase subunit delta [Opitutales bacterium]MDP4778546.1 F0F1 ATP synthase subunit delta [Opitutales bacterium]MDP4880432.1 F0F1 ATP synthase subunit delta [Opitutales bacterium]